MVDVALVRVDLQPDGVDGAGVRDGRRGPRAARLEGERHRADQHVSLRRWPLHHHRRQCRQHLPQAHARHRTRRSRRGSTTVARNDGRVPHEAEIDEAIAAWTSARPFATCFAVLEAAGVPGGPIYSVADQLADPHFVARGLFEDVTWRPARTSRCRRSRRDVVDTPGGTTWPGPPLGAHNDEVYARDARTRRRCARRAAGGRSDLDGAEADGRPGPSRRRVARLRRHAGDLCRGRRRDVAGHGDTRRGRPVRRTSARLAGTSRPRRARAHPGRRTAGGGRDPRHRRHRVPRLPRPGARSRRPARSGGAHRPSAPAHASGRRAHLRAGRRLRAPRSHRDLPVHDGGGRRCRGSVVRVRRRRRAASRRQAVLHRLAGVDVGRLRERVEAADLGRRRRRATGRAVAGLVDHDGDRHPRVVGNRLARRVVSRIADGHLRAAQGSGARAAPGAVGRAVLLSGLSTVNGGRQQETDLFTGVR